MKAIGGRARSETVVVVERMKGEERAQKAVA